MKLRSTPGTFVLLALMVAAFMVQVTIGAVDDPAMLAACGATLRSGTADGQPWRLLSGGLLHGSWGHIASNAVTIGILGLFYERIAGTARLWVVFVLSAALGAWTAASFGSSQIFVGASGSSWGLMAALMLHAWRPDSTTPKGTARALRRALLPLFVLSVLVSLLPSISLAGHAGGAVGGVFAASILGRGERHATMRSAAAVVTMLMLVGSCGIALAVGRPWRLNDLSHLEAHTFGSAGFTISVPTWMPEPTMGRMTDGRLTGMFERAPISPLTVTVQLSEEGQPGRTPLALTRLDSGWCDAWRMKRVPDGWTRVASAIDGPDEPQPSCDDRWTQGEHVVHLRIIVGPDASAEVFLQTLSGSRYERLAPEILDSAHFADAP